MALLSVYQLLNGLTDWVKILYGYFDGFLVDFKIQLDPIGGAAVGMLTTKRLGRLG